MQSALEPAAASELATVQRAEEVLASAAVPAQQRVASTCECVQCVGPECSDGVTAGRCGAEERARLGLKLGPGSGQLAACAEQELELAPGLEPEQLPEQVTEQLAESVWRGWPRGSALWLA